MTLRLGNGHLRDIQVIHLDQDFGEYIPTVVILNKETSSMILG